MIFSTEYPDFFDSIFPAFIQKSEAFYTPERKQLIMELKDILKSDQDIRKDWKNKSKQADSADYFAKMQETDSINAEHLFEIIKKYGYPNKKRYGSDFQSNMIDGGLQALLMHISCHYNIEEMILRYIQEGECAPHVYGSIIDKEILEGKWKKKSLYGIWTNGQNNEIIDILHLDERRMSIGMPTREMERKRDKLINPHCSHSSVMCRLSGIFFLRLGGFGTTDFFRTKGACLYPSA